MTPCSFRESIAFLLRSALGLQAVPDGASRKGGHGIPIPRHRREILNANGAGSARIQAQGVRHLGRVVATTGVLAVVDIGGVGAGREPTPAPSGVLGAARAAVAEAPKEA